MENVLRELGLSQKEAKIYLCLLSIGKTTASVIAYKTSIPVSTIHYVCNRLKERQLINALKKGNSIVYSPESPEKILFLLQKQRTEINRKKQAIDAILPQLKALKDSNERPPSITHCEGWDDLLKMNKQLLDSLKDSSFFYSFSNPLKVGKMPVQGDLIKAFLHSRLKKKYDYKFMIVETELSKHLKKINFFSLEKVIFIQRDEQRHSTPYAEVICENMVLNMNLSPENVSSVLIKDPQFAKVRAHMFEMAWKKEGKA